MYLAERHIVNKNNPNWESIDKLCLLSKNLYNQSLFLIKQEYEKSGRFLRYNELEKISKNQIEKYNDYYKLTASVSQQVLQVFDKNINCFLKLIKLWKKDKTKLNGCPQFPKYKDKTKGRNIVVFTNQVARLKSGFIYFPKKNNLLPIKTILKNEEKIKEIRIIPQSNNYVIEIIYEQKEKELKPNNNNYLSIDLGLNNLATCYDTKNNKSFIINGKPIKSDNQYFNKIKAKEQSQLKKNHNKYTSKKLERLSNKRSNKISDYLHKSSRIIVDYCLNNEINTLIIGYNKEWKQKINIGKVNNQKFVNIPHSKFLFMLKYKCQLEGINFIENEESYTSKCSSLDNEKICKHENYLGRRVKRGLYISNKGILINADLNGSINILRKVIGETLELDSNETINRGYVLYPKKILSF